MIRLKEILNQPSTGKPLVAKVFRGDDKRFQKFDSSFIGRSIGVNTHGFWFSNSYDAAGFYGQHVRPFEITMKNPLVFSSEDFSANAPHGPSWFAKIAKERGHDGVVILDIKDGDRYSDVYCVFDKSQIKTTTPS